VSADGSPVAPSPDRPLRVAVVGAGRSAWGGATGRRTDDGVWDVDSWEDEAPGRRPGELGGRQ